jgi:hypothetical protein
MGQPTPTAKGLERTDGLHCYPIAQHDVVLPPNGSGGASGGIILGQSGIVGELVAEIFQVGHRLTAGFADDPDVRLNTMNGYPEGKGQGGQGGFGTSPRCQDVQPAATVLDQAGKFTCKPAMKPTGWQTKVVGKVFFRPGKKRRQFPRGAAAAAGLAVGGR